MSDNVIIGVHGQAQTLEGINGINAKEATGGSTNYVPENTLIVGGKTIIENGTYNAGDDDMLGYKRVVVMDSVSEGLPKTFRDTRKHNAMIACGGRQRIFSNVKKLRARDTSNDDYIVFPQPELRTKSLSVTHPGVYDVSSETDVDAYTPVYVSVSDSERDAAGFNPSNPTWQDNLPDEIRVTTLPNKIDYNNNEEIDYTGMVVTAYRNNAVWSNEAYPNGVIPFDELMLQQMADTSIQIPYDAPRDIYYNGLWQNGAIYPAKGLSMTHECGHTYDTSRLSYYLYGKLETTMLQGICTTFILDYDNANERKTRIIYADKLTDAQIYPELHGDAVFRAEKSKWPSKQILKTEIYESGFSGMENQYTQFEGPEFSVFNRQYLIGSESLYTYPRYQYIIDGKPVVYSVCDFNRPDNYRFYHNIWDATNIKTRYVNGNNWSNAHNGIVAWYLIYGDRYAKISWKRPVDREILTTQIQINVDI